MSVPPEYQCATHPDRYEPCVSCDWLHIRRKSADTDWTNDDLRAMANALGPQIMIIQLPPVPELPWCSTDEQVGFTVDDLDQITIRSVGASGSPYSGPISPYTAMELATTLTAYLANYHHQQTHTPEGTS